MSDTNALRQRIADELNRQPSQLIGSPSLSVGLVINREINDAVRHYESTRFRWNETRNSEFATTTSGTRTVSLPATFVKMDTLKVVDTDAYVTMYPRAWDELEDMDRDVTAADGVPTRYAIYGNVLRLYPVPDATYTLVGSFIHRYRDTSLTGSYCAVLTMGGGSLTATSTASHNNQTNGWTTDGEALIRARACAAVKINYLKDERAMLEMGSLAAGRMNFLSVREQQAFERLADETNDAQAISRIRPYPV